MIILDKTKNNTLCISNNKDFIVMEAYVFPFINILWLGCLIMAVGIIISIIERIRVIKLQAIKS